MRETVFQAVLLLFVKAFATLGSTCREEKMIDRLFQLKVLKTDVRTELLPILLPYLTAAYIIFINPSVLAASSMPENALITAIILTIVWVKKIVP